MTRRSLKHCKVRIIVEARDPRDARRIIEAVESAFEQSEKDSPRKKTNDAEMPSICADEQIETEAKRRVGEHLDAKAERVEAKKKASGKPSDASTLPPLEQVIMERRKAREWLRKAAKFGYGITVQFVADVIKKIFLG